MPRNHHHHFQQYPTCGRLPWTSKHMRNILHLNNLYINLSAATFIPYTNREIKIKDIFCMWIAVYGTANKFLTSTGGEFANSEFRPPWHYHAYRTAEKSTWSNDVAKRKNQTLVYMIDKIIAETTNYPDLALTWSLYANSSFQDVAPFSPFQLVFGSTLKLPATISDELSALSINQ